MPTEIVTQRSTRDEGVFEDQFGRPYTVPKNRYGQKEQGHLFCDLAQFAKDQREAMREWTNFLWANAEIEYPSQKPVPSEMERDPLLLRRTGPKPWPSADVILIARSEEHTS